MDTLCLIPFLSSSEFCVENQVLFVHLKFSGFNDSAGFVF